MRTPDRRKELIFRLIQDLRTWRERPDALTVPQFLGERKIGYNVFRQLQQEFPALENEFETTMAILAAKWITKGLDNAKMPAHIEKMMSRYIKYYDKHTWEAEKSMKQETEYAKVMAQAAIAVENYSESQLEEPYASLYDQATKK